MFLSFAAEQNQRALVGREALVNPGADRTADVAINRTRRHVYSLQWSVFSTQAAKKWGCLNFAVHSIWCLVMQLVMGQYSMTITTGQSNNITLDDTCPLMSISFVKKINHNLP